MSDLRRTCDTCKYNPPSKEWACVDCDMREPADRWEPKDIGDLIIRQDAIKVVARAIWHYPNHSLLNNYHFAYELAEDVLKRLPSAYSDEKIQRMQDFERAQIAAKAYELGKAESKRKTGKWIHINTNHYFPLRCSICKKLTDIESDYCPNCGAFMGGEQDDN